MGRSNQTFAKVCVATTSLVSIDVGTSASVGNAEVDPGSGDLRVWKSTDPSVALVISNESGSGRDVLIKFFG